MRDRLIEKVNRILKDNFEYVPLSAAINIADDLLADSIVVPPCKVGDKIYRYVAGIDDVYEWDIVQINIYADEILFIDDSDNAFTEADIGKTVFFSREKALKGGAR